VSKKSKVNFMEGFRVMAETNEVRRHPPKAPAAAPAATPSDQVPVVLPAAPKQPRRYGKVAITHWVDPAVRKQLARLALDYDRSQGDLAAEALNLLFEKYGQPPIAASLHEDPPLLQPPV
jgi:hypothetical protein